MGIVHYYCFRFASEKSPECGTTNSSPFHGGTYSPSPENPIYLPGRPSPNANGTKVFKLFIWSNYSSEYSQEIFLHDLVAQAYDQRQMHNEIQVALCRPH